MNECFVVIAGGGTAGHVHPGLAVANALARGGYRKEEILFVGSDRGIEQDLVPSEGFELITISGTGISRRNPLAALRAIYLLIRGTMEALRLLNKRKPQVVLALGGFACFPCALASLVLKIPVVAHEQNAVPGLANKVISRWARHSAVSYKDTSLRNAVYTGNPVRQSIIDARRIEPACIREKLKVPSENLFVVVTGGSLGAKKINLALRDAIPLLDKGMGLTVYHIIGRRDWEELFRSEEELRNYVDYRPIEFEYDMPSILRSADLIISRAGGSITAEIAALDLPSVLVPLPNAPGDHQTANAKSMVDLGSARILTDENCDGLSLSALMNELIKSREELHRMRRRAEMNNQINASEALASLLKKEAL
ncbi:MAG: undecaprenyldiphospho-muramoylpentapeptide beta-N-acetylglucosaminyltransferase [Actinobacteria bacterium]|nr:undecaprenyldiphospho-muramoylpentapeptide beta-N-acetylglucosaminyltransferase [Actinomycetota bacterium]|tara:strand:+ start:5421 stop:6524 length:1104 start_codon:yes stop_codon:yes gene_type:complete